MTHLMNENRRIFAMMIYEKNFAKLWKNHRNFLQFRFKSQITKISWLFEITKCVNSKKRKNFNSKSFDQYIFNKIIFEITEKKRKSSINLLTNQLISQLIRSLTSPSINQLASLMINQLINSLISFLVNQSIRFSMNFSMSLSTSSSTSFPIRFSATRSISQSNNCSNFSFFRQQWLHFFFS